MYISRHITKPNLKICIPVALHIRYIRNSIAIYSIYILHSQISSYVKGNKRSINLSICHNITYFKTI